MPSVITSVQVLQICPYVHPDVAFWYYSFPGVENMSSTTANLILFTSAQALQIESYSPDFAIWQYFCRCAANLNLSHLGIGIWHCFCPDVVIWHLLSSVGICHVQVLESAHDPTICLIWRYSFSRCCNLTLHLSRCWDLQWLRPRHWNLTLLFSKCYNLTFLLFMYWNLTLLLSRRWNLTLILSRWWNLTLFLSRCCWYCFSRCLNLTLFLSRCWNSTMLLLVVGIRHCFCPDVGIWYYSFPGVRIWHCLCLGVVIWHYSCLGLEIWHYFCPGVWIWHCSCPGVGIWHIAPVQVLESDIAPVQVLESDIAPVQVLESDTLLLSRCMIPTCWIWIGAVKRLRTFPSSTSAGRRFPWRWTILCTCYQ